MCTAFCPAAPAQLVSVSSQARQQPWFTQTERTPTFPFRVSYERIGAVQRLAGADEQEGLNQNQNQLR